MKKLLIVFLCIVLVGQSSMTTYAMEGKDILGEELLGENYTEEIEQESKEEDTEQENKEESKEEDTEQENKEESKEESKEEDTEQENKEESKEEDTEQENKEESKEEDTEQESKEEILNQGNKEELEKDNKETVSEEGMSEQDEDPLHGRENGYVDEQFYGITSWGIGNNEYTHNSKFDDSLIENVIDVSKYQGDIDWQMVKKSGIDYAIIRAGFRGYGEEGTLNTDNYFVKNIKQALSAGVQVGVYFFSQAINIEEAHEEAKYLLDLIEGYKISLPVTIDYEYASTKDGLTGRLYKANLSKDEATDICIKFCQTVEANGYQAMVYANKDMLENGLHASRITEKYDIWIANYGNVCSYEGDYQFWQYTQDGAVEGISGKVDKSFWYKETESFYNGVDYSVVYNFKFYTEKYSDIKNAYGNDPQAALRHFVNYGMKEGRQGNAEFNAKTYRNRYTDLRKAYGNDWEKYYIHYIKYGKNEGRDGSGTAPYVSLVTSYKGVDYSSVYDYTYYTEKYSDIKRAYGDDESAVIAHFVNYGMSEGRQGNGSFNVKTYRNRYADLRKAYGKNWINYYNHYINYGKKEERNGSGTSELLNPATVYNGVDYSAVYDFSYYTKKYSDIRRLYSEDDIAALKHFVNYGMSEGRQGNSAFDVYSYKSINRDLINVYGNNLKSYYIHYISYGYIEGRQVSDIGRIISCKISNVSSDVVTIQIELELQDVIEKYDRYYIIGVDWNNKSEVESILESREGKDSTEIVNITVTNREAKALLQGKIALGIENSKGKMSIVSPLTYITNPEKLASNTVSIFQGTSKKGLQGITYASYNGGDDIVDARNANTKHTLLNLDISTIVSTTPKVGYTSYSYKGNTYYFSNLAALKNNISSLNSGYKQYLNGNSGTTPVVVSLCLLLGYSAENSYLIDPAARTSGHSYYLLNIREEKARETLEALFFYLGETFGQENCYVSNWILGNEINSSRAWNYGGSLRFDTYMDCYTTAFRMLYNGVKATKTGNTVSISLDNGWTATPDTYAGKTTLDAFAKKIHALNPNIDWSIAYHAYSYPLTKADFWNDYSNTTDSLSTKYISMRNIKVLTDYAGTLEKNYGKVSGTIRVLLTEQGYSYGAGSEVQAQAIARGYYIAQFNDRIDAFIIRAVVDDKDETQGKLYFGLMNRNSEKRIAFYVYEYMDSDIDNFSKVSASGTVTSENYSKFNKAKEIVCNTNWSSIVPGFNKEKLANIK